MHTGVAEEVDHGHFASGRTAHVHGRGARLERRRWAEGDSDSVDGREHFSAEVAARRRAAMVAEIWAFAKTLRQVGNQY